MDIMSKKERSKRMSKIRSKWTKQELFMHNYLKGNKIQHQMHSRIVGNPDIILKSKKLAVFLHGCFWHGCPKCYRKPKTNKEYWIPKIQKNKKRDATNIKKLKFAKYRVLKIWEHDLKVENMEKFMEKMR